MKNDITELREHLFATLRGLRDKDAPMELDRARTISSVAATLIDSARVEVELLKVVGGGEGTGFIPQGTAGGASLPPGITSVRQHRLKG